MYPFIFNVPSNTPPSMDNLWFANKRIEIKYFISVKGVEAT